MENNKRVCSRCGLGKEESDFYKGINNRYCIECTKEYKRERREEQKKHSKIIECWNSVPLKELVGEVVSDEDLNLTLIELVRKYFPEKL